jgi:LysM repeat protein
MQPVARILALVAALALVLFALPFAFKAITGGSQAGASPTPFPSASAAPTESSAPTPKPEPTPIVHIVKSGESLSKIAQRYGVTVDQILSANPQIKNPDRIKLGDPITIPAPAPSEIVDEGAQASP